MTDRIPGWLVSTGDQAGRRTYSADEERADIVRRTFTETVQGFGRRAIARGLNRDGKLSFLSETSWQPSNVIKITRARTTVGEYQPHRRDEGGRRMPDGDPIKGYYPVSSTKPCGFKPMRPSAFAEKTQGDVRMPRSPTSIARIGGLDGGGYGLDGLFPCRLLEQGEYTGISGGCTR
jgi:hypothetical protein